LARAKRFSTPNQQRSGPGSRTKSESFDFRSAEFAPWVLGATMQSRTLCSHQFALGRIDLDQLSACFAVLRIVVQRMALLTTG